ncbi:hypothetical protein HU200_047672 [Digitaria exilis]|uniref:Uncharacterized protein n=1 Tax=Digitaria exilis TaxID=1010633 RepID=A0A835AUD7_9POAL|nr:hypothetical protein HU200_047672 [Digitaria exilis]
MPRRPFHLAAICLVILALLPPRASSLHMGGARDAPSSSTGLQVHQDASPLVARREDHQQRATAPSPQAAAPPVPTRRSHVRSASRVRYTHYGATLANLRSVCQPPLCFADSDHRLLTVLYGPHFGGGSSDDDDYVYVIARTTEGMQPVLPFSSWRAHVYSGDDDVCHVEIAYMTIASFIAIDCPAWTCYRRFTSSADEALAWAISAIATPCGGGTTTSSGAAATASPANAVVALLPLLAAAAFLPPPMAAAMALSSMASLAIAATGGHSDEEYTTLNHATCAVYAYDNVTGTINRARPVPGLRVLCQRPLCFGAADLDERTLSVVHGESHGRRDDPIRVYCAVHSLEGAASPSIFFPWTNTWRAHLPIADPGTTTVDSGDHLCHVELAHMDYRESYYIRCPAAGGHAAQVSCTEFPEEEVASAVWEHRRLTYRGTVGLKCELYKYRAAGQFLGYDYNAEL